MTSVSQPRTAVSRAKEGSLDTFVLRSRTRKKSIERQVSISFPRSLSLFSSLPSSLLLISIVPSHQPLILVHPFKLASTMKISFITLSTLALSAGLISAVSVPKSYIPAHGNAEYGPADPLTLAMRVEGFRQSIYGEENSTNQSTQSNAQEQAPIEDSSAGCGSNCKSTLSFAGSGE